MPVWFKTLDHGDFDPLSLWPSWSTPTQAAHPASPAGGTGPGRSRAPAPDLGASQHGAPHATAPAARLASATWYDRLQDQASLTQIKSYFECLSIRESNWKFVTSGAGELSIGTTIVRVSANATAGALWLKEGEDGTPISLAYGGVGGAFAFSAIPFPAKFSFSIPQMPSYGTVYQLPYSGKTLSMKELSGALILITGAADASAGWSGSLMFIGGSMALAATLGAITSGAAYLATSNACVRFHGMGVTLIPYNVGVSAYVGALSVVS